MKRPVTEEVRAMLGKRVRVMYTEAKPFVVGKLIGFGEGGEFEILEDDGMVHYCWPMLRIEEVKA